MKDLTSIVKQLESKKKRLEKALQTNEPIVPNLIPNHDRKIQNAQIFLDELEEILPAIDSLENIQLVTLPTIEKKIMTADYSSYELDGTFVKLVLIQNCPYDDLFLLYVAPVEAI